MTEATWSCSGLRAYGDMCVLKATKILVAALMIAGCTAQSAAPSASPTSATASETGSTSTTQTESPSTPVTSDGGLTGGVSGVIYSTTMKAPMKAYLIYLAEKLPLTPGPKYLLTIQQNGSPHAETDAEGHFHMEGVGPGDYALIIWTPQTSYVIPDASGKNELPVVVQKGEITDLGLINIDWP